jgi:exosortase J
MNTRIDFQHVSNTLDLFFEHFYTPRNSCPEFDRPKPHTHRMHLWVCLALLAFIGWLGVSPQLITLWGIWTTDPLRSIGMLIVPASIVLVLRAWRQLNWELCGTWWGLILVFIAFCPIIYSWDLTFSWVVGFMTVFVLPFALPIYLYACGFILLFGGIRVFLKAWFPLALLLFAQPVPESIVVFLDLPLQGLSAHIARFFALLIGFPPANRELLRLMFTPDFGMFIAPGCDGMRGAVTLGYVALIIGYLKRVSILRWSLYVLGAVLLGHLFNLIRLCTLVLYYRIAVGHPSLEHIAKQADYAIGGCLFVAAAVLFLLVALRKNEGIGADDGLSQLYTAAMTSIDRRRSIYWKVWAFAILAMIACIFAVHSIRNHTESLVASLHDDDQASKKLDDRLPLRLGGYTRVRTWQEQLDGQTSLESAAYLALPFNEVTVGIWLLPREHNIHYSWMIRGESAEMRGSQNFITADGRSVSFDTAYYSDGITDKLAGNTYCNPSHCLTVPKSESGVNFHFRKIIDFTTRGSRFVPMFFWVERPHTNLPKSEIYKELKDECQDFLVNVDFSEFSQRFQ